MKMNHKEINVDTSSIKILSALVLSLLFRNTVPIGKKFKGRFLGLMDIESIYQLGFSEWLPLKMLQSARNRTEEVHHRTHPNENNHFEVSGK